MSLQLATSTATPAKAALSEDAELAIRFLRLTVQQLLDEVQRLFDHLEAGGNQSHDRWDVVTKIDDLLCEAKTYFGEVCEELERLGA
jgi:hypothetical protein